MKSYFKFLSRNKAYTAIDVFGLAVSMMFVMLIGCYAWQESHIDRQHAKAERMYYIGFDMDGEKMMGGHWYVQKLLRNKFPEIESSTAIYRSHRQLEYGGQSVETDCYFVDSTFYDLFDFKLIRGDRTTVLDNPSGVVVTEEYARRVWGDEEPMGKSIMFNVEAEPLVVTGVMEPMTNTAFMTADRRPVDMLLNFSMMKYVNPYLVDTYMSNAAGVDVIFLAREGHDLTKRKKEYEESLKSDFWILRLPEDNIRFEVYPFDENYFSEIGSSSNHINSGDPKTLKLLFGVGLVILLFAVMNYINLTVALAGKRAKEMATRRLLGESRIRVMWRLIGESTLLCAVSMVIGIVLAFVMAPNASALLDTRLDIAGCMNVTTVGFIVVLLLIMGFASGMIPALMLSSMKPIQAVRGAFSRKSNMVYGKIFIVVQNVATITMVASAITIFCQVRHMIEAPLGYDYDHVICVSYPYGYRDKGSLLKEELLKQPCVQKVSFCQGTPLDRGNNDTMIFDDRTISFQVFIGDSAYIDLLGIKIKRDNNITVGKSKNFVSVGAMEALGFEEDTPYLPLRNGLSVSGIFEDFNIGTILTERHPLMIFEGTPFENFTPWSILVKVRGDEEEALAQVKGVFAKLFDNEYIDASFDSPFLRQQIERKFESESRLSTIIAIFAAIAVMISMLGLMAMSTYYVRQREHDIAVYKVMGGTSIELLGRLVRTFMLYVVIAAVLSVPLIYYVMNDWLSQFSYRISVYWWIYAVSVLLAIIICLVSVVAQCAIAANANPAKTLK
ncbi:MAG: ABC transporter permease [Muribaculaceae bacterium]|nr:ABC transporter permease [Muribaculaceae bacterium]